MIIDHLGLTVSDYQKSKAFYEQVLETLGIALVMEVAGWAGFGKKLKPEFWIREGIKSESYIHIAFVAENRHEVDNFYQAGLKAGGQDNGPPGIREMFHPNYYGSFILDPDGYNIEAVCHKTE